MLEKIGALLKNAKLINFVLVFGVTALGVAVVTVIAWSDCLVKRVKQRRRAFKDAHAAEKDLDE